MSTATSESEKPAEKKGGLAAIPVALTVLATIFAGMSSSEMTRSMFYRSLAAQYQAKAGDQWGLFQAKKIRGSTLDAAGDLSLLFSVKPFDEAMANGLRQAADQATAAQIAKENAVFLAALLKLRLALNQDDLQSAYRYLSTSELPTAQNKPADDSLNELLKAIREVFAGEPLARLEYAAVVEPQNLKPAKRVISGCVALVAARVGAVRLIDNLILGPRRRLMRSIRRATRSSNRFEIWNARSATCTA